MTQQVLVPMDTSGPATAALEYALTRFPDAEIVVLYACGINEADGSLRERVLRSEFERERIQQERIAEKIFQAAADSAEQAGATVSTALEYGLPIRAITSYAEDHDVDRIVIGTHDRKGLSRLLLGSVVEVVMRRSPVPVTVRSAGARTPE